MIHREDAEQKALIQWADMTVMPAHWRSRGYDKIGDYLFAIPNGGARGKTEAARLKGLGVRAGVSDLMFAFPIGNFHGLFIEMKAQKPHDSPVSMHQRVFLERQGELGYQVVVCCGFAAAQGDILDYMGL